MTGWQAAVAALVPSIGVGLLFWWAMRAVVNADRNERRAQARIDADPATGTKSSDDAGSV